MPLKMNGLRLFWSGIDDAIDDGTFATAREAAEIMRPNTPVDEGDLQSTDRVEPAAPDGSAEYAVRSGGIPGPNKMVDYAAMVNARDPFFDEAIQEVDLRANVLTRVKALAKRSKA